MEKEQRKIMLDEDRKDKLIAILQAVVIGAFFLAALQGEKSGKKKGKKKNKKKETA